MLVYEVNLFIEPEIFAEFKKWLDPHIHEVVGTGCFERAVLFGQEDQDERRCLTAHYFSPSQEALDRYLKDHAPALREDGVKKFGGKFSATRRILGILREYDSSK